MHSEDLREREAGNHRRRIDVVRYIPAMPDRRSRISRLCSAANWMKIRIALRRNRSALWPRIRCALRASPLQLRWGLIRITRMAIFLATGHFCRKRRVGRKEATQCPSPNFVTRLNSWSTHSWSQRSSAPFWRHGPQMPAPSKTGLTCGDRPAHRNQFASMTSCPQCAHWMIAGAEDVRKTFQILAA